ncbi:hypothetical protein [Mesorhizobium sp. M0088]|uniref:hypothetical protein n=1 Tax=Mesorhizobium sp. M0088 TaxID=2956873 RepID=UPI00333B16D8
MAEIDTPVRVTNIKRSCSGHWFPGVVHHSQLRRDSIGKRLDHRALKLLSQERRKLPDRQTRLLRKNHMKFAPFIRPLCIRLSRWEKRLALDGNPGEGAFFHM